MFTLDTLRAMAARIAAGRPTAEDLVNAHAIAARQAYVRNVKAGAR